jgi:hypothetical protein
MSDGLKLGLEIAIPIVLGVALILGLVFGIVGSLMRKRLAAQVIVLRQEGIERDSGIVRGSVRMRDFVMPGLRAASRWATVSKQLVLTRRSFVILGGIPSLAPIPRTELQRYGVKSDGGSLVISTDNPVHASGHMELKLRVQDADAWVKALRDAGAMGH